MIRRVLQTFTLAVVCQTVTLQTASADSLFDIAVGPRVDELRWSIAGSRGGGSPDVLSELTWRNVNSIEVRGGFDTVTIYGIRIQGSAGIGSIYDGETQDSDYLSDDRTNEFVRSYSDSDGDDVLDLSISVGKVIKVTNTNGTTLTPFIGIAYSEQNYNMDNGFTVLDTLGSSAGTPLTGLNSSYDTEWRTMFVGLQVDHQTPKWDVYGRVEFHRTDYEAKADWNLRADLAHPVSFSHSIDGSGPSYQLGFRYHMDKYWSFNGSINWLNFDSDNGVDTTYFADGTSASTDLNTVEWHKNSVMLGISYISGR